MAWVRDEYDIGAQDRPALLEIGAFLDEKYHQGFKGKIYKKQKQRRIRVNPNDCYDFAKKIRAYLAKHADIKYTEFKRKTGVLLFHFEKAEDCSNTWLYVCFLGRGPA